MKTKEWFILAAIVIMATVLVILPFVSFFTVHQDDVLIKDAVRKTVGYESRTVNYFAFTDKGYFRVAGPVDADGTPHVWKEVEESLNKQITVKYYGWRVDAWMWYPHITEVQSVK